MKNMVLRIYTQSEIFNSLIGHDFKKVANRGIGDHVRYAPNRLLINTEDGLKGMVWATETSKMMESPNEKVDEQQAYTAMERTCKSRSHT